MLGKDEMLCWKDIAVFLRLFLSAVSFFICHFLSVLRPCLFIRFFNSVLASLPPSISFSLFLAFLSAHSYAHLSVFFFLAKSVYLSISVTLEQTFKHILERCGNSQTKGGIYLSGSQFHYSSNHDNPALACKWR